MTAPKTYACAECRYYAAHRCKLWEVAVKEPDESHCESLTLTRAIAKRDGQPVRI